ncbi:MAG: SDR family NAD(P)-dependent oxidoreductase [Eubacteriales bacterium]
MIKVDYSSRTVIVTGAAGGIGSRMCSIFAANGASVAVCDINLAGCTAVADAIKADGGIAVPFILDVTDRESLVSVSEQIVKYFGSVDLLINNAGVNVGPNDRNPIKSFSDEKWDWIIGVDLDGVYNVSKTFIPYMLNRDGANIINISSVVGLVPFRRQCAFTAAKAGVVNLTKAMAIELAEDGIRVNCIAPGSILMEGTRALFYNDPAKAEAMMINIPQHRPGSPEDIAYAALYLGADCAGYVTGSVLTVDGGWTCGFARDF